MTAIDEIYKKIHLNKSERLKSFEATVKNIFDKKLQKFGNIFEQPKRPSKITHVQIFNCFGNYYFRQAHKKIIKTLMCFDEEDKSGKTFILFRAVSLKPHICFHRDYEIDHDFTGLVNNEELKHYTLSTCLVRLIESFPF